MGSKQFTQWLADKIRLLLHQLLDDDGFDDFELNLTQDMVHFGDLPHDVFLRVANFITDIDDNHDELNTLMVKLKSDPRFAN
ncbi:hypothetical protein ACFBZI_08740 [Moraxella sp. ZJ142]|uniref:hypothetical protein n=1 Tax=Moraxella marmotae TaxID=3344520 RepID=UPI0035D510EF